MEPQAGARHIARERGTFDRPERPEPIEPPRSPLAQRLDAASILAVLPWLRIETVAEFEREYGPR